MKYRTISVGRWLELCAFDGRRSDRGATLRRFCGFYSHLPSQDSPEWAEERRRRYFSIGGSEIASLLVDDPKKKNKRSELLGSKLGLPQFAFVENPDCNWGKIFEPVIRMYAEKLFACEIRELGTLPGMRDSDGNIIQTYSPDGLGVVVRDLLVAGITHPTKKFKAATLAPESVVLFEFKCPYRRLIGDVIPAYYRPQPKLGMCTIPVADMAVYIEGVYRKCSVAQFGMNNEYDFSFHQRNACNVELETQRLGKTICAGFIGVYSISGLAASRTVSSTSAVPINCHTVAEIPAALLAAVEREIAHPLSPWHGTVMCSANIVSIIMLINSRLNELSNSGYMMPESSAQETGIITDCLRVLIPNLDPGVEKILDDALLALSPTNRMLPRDGDTISGVNARELGIFGDFSEASFYPFIMNYRSYKFYYPSAYYGTNSDRGTYVDMSLSESNRARLWLSEEVARFRRFCGDRRYEMCGIVPWKMLRIGIHPVMKTAGFAKKAQSKIEEFVSVVRKYHAQPDLVSKDPFLSKKMSSSPSTTVPVFSSAPKSVNTVNSPAVAKAMEDLFD